LREALASSKRTVDALVLPPSLGVQQARAQVLSRRTGVPCGEALAMPGGPAGLRFENARDRALASEGVSRSRARAKGTKRTESRWLVATEEGATLEADAVVLATGGLLGGGLEYFPSESMPAAALPPCARTPLRFTLDAPLIVGENGLPLELPGSLFGVAPESLAWPFSRDALLERAGVLVDADGRVRAFGDGPRGLFASGELVADTARTWLAAFSSGVRAGAAAAREALGERDGAVSAPRGAESEPPPSPFAGPASRP
jgi:hypothetical protein